MESYFKFCEKGRKNMRLIKKKFWRKLFQKLSEKMLTIYENSKAIISFKKKFAKLSEKF